MAFGGVVLGASISAITGILGLILFSAFYATMCTAYLTADVTGVLDMIPLILAFVIVISIIIGGLGFALGGRI